jgi:HK97 family phage portal protein
MNHRQWLRHMRRKNRRTPRAVAQPAARGKDWSYFEALMGLQRSATADRDHAWTTRQTRDYERLYGEQSLVFACVRKISTALREAPARVAVRGDDGWEDLDNHPLADLLDRPNPVQGYAEYIEYRAMCLLLTGISWVLKIRNNAGQLAELHPFPTSWLRRRGDKLMLHQGREGEVEVLAEDLMGARFPDPQNPQGYVGPLQAAQRDQQVDEERQDTIGEMLRNYTAPGLILYQPSGYTEPQKRDIRATLRERVGPGRRGSPLFMEGEDARVEMPAPLADLDWPGLTGLSETRICAAFGIPPQIVGVRAGESAKTYANYEQARKSFYEDTMVPLWWMLDAADSRGLLWSERELDRGTQIYHDTSEVRALQENTDEKAKRAGALWKDGLITRNEARSLAGLEPVDDAQGDVYMQTLNQILVPADDSTGAPPDDDEADQPPDEADDDEEAEATGDDSNDSDKDA